MTVTGVGVVLSRPGPEILAITRGFDVDDLGFPGGHVDLTDRSIRHAAARELYEETQVVVDPNNLSYVSHCRTSSGGVYVLFKVLFVKLWPQVLQSIPFEGYVGWYSPKELTTSSSRYGCFQHRALKKLGLMT